MLSLLSFFQFSAFLKADVGVHKKCCAAEKRDNGSQAMSLFIQNE